jgi:hypothetical protein
MPQGIPGEFIGCHKGVEPTSVESETEQGIHTPEKV